MDSHRGSRKAANKERLRNCQYEEMKSCGLKKLRLKDWVTILKCTKGYCTHTAKLLSIFTKKTMGHSGATGNNSAKRCRCPALAWEPSSTLQGQLRALALRRLPRSCTPVCGTVSQHPPLLEDHGQCHRDGVKGASNRSTVPHLYCAATTRKSR